jgi:hypothetical protein
MKIRKNNRLRGGRQGVTPAPSVKKEIAKSRGRAFALMEWGWNQDSLLQRGRRVRVEDRCAAIVLHSSILSHSGEVCISAPLSVSSPSQGEDESEGPITARLFCARFKILLLLLTKIAVTHRSEGEKEDARRIRAIAAHLVLHPDPPPT